MPLCTPDVTPLTVCSLLHSTCHSSIRFCWHRLGHRTEQLFDGFLELPGLSYFADVLRLLVLIIQRSELLPIILIPLLLSLLMLLS